MRTLLQRGLMAEAGTEPETGAILYTTTNYFLERMGLRGLDELPELAPFLPEADAIEAERPGRLYRRSTRTRLDDDVPGRPVTPGTDDEDDQTDI
ncbi:Segregation and condensation protein B OS=Streptomyces violarus OX=67380 GN=FHS41_006489 PE=4 SV=1 [Streptomyces violarus]